jgi:hypothetical protein
MGVRKGGQEGALAPLADQIVCFSNFYEENSIFIGVLVTTVQNSISTKKRDEAGGQSKV